MVSTTEMIFPKARIPYGTWGASYFPAWQTSPLAEVNIGQFAAESMNRILGIRRVPIKKLDYLVSASTVPWHWKFWNSPTLSSLMDHRVPGFHLEQACATGLQSVIHAAAEVEAGDKEVVGVLTFDRTSDSPASIFPERRAYRRTEVISDVWDNFGFDPATEKSMIAAAGNVARKYRLDRSEVDELAAHRYQQYFDTVESDFHQAVMVPLEILNVQGRSMGVIDQDLGVKQISISAMREMSELDSCVTSGTQTHAGDGMACLLVTNEEQAAELSSKPEIKISLVAKSEVRTGPSLMPEAPTLAVKRILERTGLTIDDMGVIKSHNPFAVNDLVLAHQLDFNWRMMNNTGCSLVWGHPQGPTLTRLIIEGLEEGVRLGGGYVLICGCAAGDVGIAAIFKVS
ncbi:MAG: thiolase family protein [Bdellovibrionales bacterium]|jgi:acetyl-CoA C-acetyltransferase|nr:thiolase family protein [Bdellovibrionales bacterium]MBT3524810.1 thiolase family protein [Bdellovibrionales bacterium]MBT7670083.1 thiolase family protein [Bdellovibrionales bacterium]MBT7768177.1 thiolase family protein [Bdellovibrionales bacterium]